jgi:DNA primase
VSDSSRAKYVNSPETPLFTKSKLLYGLDIARHAMRKSRTALVVEGYTDCIVAHQYGFEDAVAVLGTALTERHVRTLSPFADRIVLVLDGDEAGQRRANEVLELFVAAQVDLRVVTLPEESDPADFLEEHGAEAFRDLLADRAVDALEHAYQAKTHGVDLDRDVHAASRVLEEMVSIVAKAPRLRHDTTHEHRFREQKILERLAFRFRVSERVVRDRLTALRRAARRRAASGQSGTSAPPEAAAAKPARTVGPWERELLEILIGHPECLAAVRAEIPPEQVAPGPCRAIYETCCRLSDAGQRATFDRLILQFDEPAIKSLLVQLDEEAQNKAAVDPESLLKELFRRRKTHAEDPTQLAAFRDEGLERRDKEQMLRNMVRELRARHGISDPTDG